MKKQILLIIINFILLSVILISSGEQMSTMVISHKDYYNNSYQKIITPYIDFELPIQATHYWNSKGLDTYEIIVSNISFKGYTEDIFKITWNDERYLTDKIRINYTIKNGLLELKNIVPYSINKNSKLTFNNFTVEIGNIINYDYKVINDSNKIINISYPIYSWNKYKDINLTKLNPIAATLSYTAIDDINISVCGEINSAGIYILNKSITSSGTCITITASDIILNGDGNTIEYNTGGGNNQYGVSINGNLLNTTIKNCNISQADLGGISSHGIYILNGINSSILENNTIKTSTSGSYAIYFSSGVSINSIIKLNNLLGSNLGSATSNIFQNVSFLDQTIKDYSFSNLAGNATFENSTYGKIYLIEMGGIGNNLIGNSTSDIRIGNNSVYVNSAQSNLNKSANVTLYNIFGITNPSVYRDGIICSDICSNLIKNGNNYSFSVTGWSNYSIGETPTVSSSVYDLFTTSIIKIIIGFITLIILIIFIGFALYYLKSNSSSPEQFIKGIIILLIILFLGTALIDYISSLL